MLLQLNYIWRLLGTGLAFMLFGMGGLFLSLFAFPLIRLFCADLRKRAAYAQKLVHKIFYLYIWFLSFIGIIKVDIYGDEKLRSDVGTLIIANHPSLLDVVLLMSLMSRAQCIVKHEIWSNPFLKGVMQSTCYIRNDGNAESLVKDCVAALNARDNLIVFPEGSRTVPGRELKIQRGVANIAVRAGAPIRIVSIQCEPATLMKGQKWYEIPPVKAHFTIRVGEIIQSAAFLENEMPAPIAARHLSEHILNVLKSAQRGHV